MFLIYPINKYKIDVDYIVKVSGLIIAIYTGVSFLIIVTFIDSSFSSTYLNFFVEVSAGSNSLRDFVGGDGTISFHIGTVPFIYLSFVALMVGYKYCNSYEIYSLVKADQTIDLTMLEFSVVYSKVTELALAIIVFIFINKKLKRLKAWFKSL